LISFLLRYGIAGLSVAFLLAATTLHPYRAAAEGAISVGTPKDVAKDGFAYGISTNKPDMQAARAEALETCRAPSDSKSEQARKLCSVFGTFTNECVAVAMDPASGTPGVGWAIGGTTKLAEANALAKCKTTAGEGRDGFCKIDNSRCDGTAK
jgi:hypothetical protein